MVVTLVEHLGAGSPAGPLMLEAVATESAALLADERWVGPGLVRVDAAFSTTLWACLLHSVWPSTVPAKRLGRRGLTHHHQNF